MKRKKKEEKSARADHATACSCIQEEAGTQGMGNNAKPVSYNLQLETRSRQSRGPVERASERTSAAATAVSRQSALGSIINGFLRKSARRSLIINHRSFARAKNPVAYVTHVGKTQVSDDDKTRRDDIRAPFVFRN